MSNRLAWLLICLTLAGIYVGSLAGLLLPLLKKRLTAPAQAPSLAGAMNSFKQCILSDDGWAATISDPINDEELRCSINNKGCADGETAHNFRLSAIRTSGLTGACLPNFESQLPNQGLTEFGQPCSTFGTVDCPYRVEFNWVAHCSSKRKARCFYPTEEVIISTQYKKGLSTEPSPLNLGMA